MKKLFLLLAASLMISAAWAQQASYDVIYTTNYDAIEAVVTAISDAEIKYKTADNLYGPEYTMPTSQVGKILFKNGTERRFARTAAQPVAPQPVAQPQPAAPANPSAPANQIAEPAAKPATPAPKLPIGFQFNIDVDGNLAFLSTSRIRYSDANITVAPRDNDFAIGGVNLTLGAGVRIAEWMFAGIAAGVLGEWGNPKIDFTHNGTTEKNVKATYSAYTVPIYADFRAYAPTHGNCYPYAEVGIGGYVGLDGSVQCGDFKESLNSEKNTGGFYFLSGVGLEFKYLNIGAGYKLMRNNNFTGNHGYVKIGFSFGRCNKLRQAKL